MPAKTKAKNHSVYMGREMTHHHLTHIEHHTWHLNNWQKVLITLGIMLALAIMIIGLALEA